MMRFAAEATLTLSLTAGQGGEAAEGSEGNPYIIDALPATLNVTLTEANCWDGLFYQYTVTEAGTISAVGQDLYITVLLNGEYSSLPAELNVGDILVLNPWSMGAGNYSMNVFYGLPEADGSFDYPYVIESLPYTYTAEGSHDMYFTYTPTETGTLMITYPENNYVSGLLDFEKLDTYYLASVTAGETILINPWGDNAGDYVISVYDGEGGGDLGGGDLGGGSDVESAPMSAENVDISADESIDVYFTPIQDGILTVNISADPGFKFWVYETPTLPESDVSGTYTYELVAGVEYQISIIGYYDWSEADATISYNITFEGGEIGGAIEDLDESTVELVVGEQNVELLANAITTLYNFTAPEAGVYTVTIPDEAFAELYNVAWISYQISEGNTLVFTATADEQGFLIGLTSELDFVNIKIEKTGTYTPPAETTYLDYEATVEFDEDFVMPEGEVTSVDITAAQTVVLGTDGYYHLGTANGPILYVNLNSEGFTLATLMSAGAPITMRGEKFEGQDGQLYCYDYMNLIAYGDYFGYSYDNDYYPLNDDLMAFFQDYGAAQGWYNADFSGFDAIKAGGFNEESAWMVALVYIADDANQGGNTGNEGGNTGNQGGNTGNQGGNTGNEGGNTGNEGGNTGNNATTGDFGVIAAAVALGMSAICGTAVIAKKKEN